MWTLKKGCPGKGLLTKQRWGAVGLDLKIGFSVKLEVVPVYTEVCQYDFSFSFFCVCGDRCFSFF